MKAPALSVELLAGVAVVGLALAWLWGRSNASGQSMAAELGQAVGGAVVDAGAGVVVGIGQAVGIPATSPSACDLARASGSWFDRSLHCPAGDFLGDVWDAATGQTVNTGSVSGSW